MKPLSGALFGTTLLVVCATLTGALERLSVFTAANIGGTQVRILSDRPAASKVGTVHYCIPSETNTKSQSGNSTLCAKIRIGFNKKKLHFNLCSVNDLQWHFRQILQFCL